MLLGVPAGDGCDIVVADEEEDDRDDDDDDDDDAPFWLILLIKGEPISGIDEGEICSGKIFAALRSLLDDIVSFIGAATFNSTDDDDDEMMSDGYFYRDDYSSLALYCGL